MEKSVLARLRDILKGWGPADPRNVLRETDSFTNCEWDLTVTVRAQICIQPSV